MHLATQSTICQDIIFPYVDNILPALYENPQFTSNAVEYQNLKATLQTFVVIAFNINVFRSQFNESDFLIRIMDAPLVPSSIGFLELLIKICVNCDISKSRYCQDIVAKLEGGFNSLPEDKQKRLERRLDASSHSLPLSRSNPRALQIFPSIFKNIDTEAGVTGDGTKPGRTSLIKREYSECSCLAVVVLE